MSPLFSCIGLDDAASKANENHGCWTIPFAPRRVAWGVPRYSQARLLGGWSRPNASSEPQSDSSQPWQWISRRACALVKQLMVSWPKSWISKVNVWSSPIVLELEHRLRLSHLRLWGAQHIGSSWHQSRDCSLEGFTGNRPNAHTTQLRSLTPPNLFLFFKVARKF